MLSVEELNDRLIDLAFAEDIGDGDHTTLCCIPADAMGAGRRGHDRHRAGEEPVADGASDVEHHATYEWHCYHDEQVCGAAEGDEYPCAGHA